jgi:hypothetical protein
VPTALASFVLAAACGRDGSRRGVRAPRGIEQGQARVDIGSLCGRLEPRARRSAEGTQRTTVNGVATGLRLCANFAARIGVHVRCAAGARGSSGPRADGASSTLRPGAMAPPLASRRSEVTTLRGDAFGPIRRSVALWVIGTGTANAENYQARATQGEGPDLGFVHHFFLLSVSPCSKRSFQRHGIKFCKAHAHPPARRSSRIPP